MIGYVDSSVVLRELLQQPASLPLPPLSKAFSSALLKVECLRTVDRLRLTGAIGDDQLVDLVGQIGEKCRMLHLVDISADILSVAGRSLPVVLGTLDAIHLATALSIGASEEEQPILLTHDHQLGLAGKSMGLRVMGDG
jgi:hypothetical protein